MLVYSLKTVALTIGAKSLSEEALKHEKAAKTKDAKTIRENFSEKMKKFRKTLDFYPKEKL